MHFGSPSDPSQTAAAEGTRSEFQRASQTATKQGEAKLCTLYFKTTWSEFQKPCQTAVTQGEAELRIYNLKKTSPPQSRSQGTS